LKNGGNISKQNSIIQAKLPTRVSESTTFNVSMGQRRRLRESLFPGVPPYHVFLPLGEEYQDPVCHGRSQEEYQEPLCHGRSQEEYQEPVCLGRSQEEYQEPVCHGTVGHRRSTKSLYAM
jgi:hypothetical protein